MSIRAIWIISLHPNELGKVIYSRKFQTVERRAKRNKCYVGIPKDDLLGQSLKVKFALEKDSKEFLQWRDTAQNEMQTPVFDVKIQDKDLWPLLAVEQQPFLFCCLPFMEDECEMERPSVFQVPSISVGFSVLLGIMKFIGHSSSGLTETSTKFLELDNYLTLSMPFGQPSDTEPATAVSLLLFSENTFLGAKKKQPAWKPIIHKGKSVLSIEVQEFVSSSQYDQPDFHPVIEVYGTVVVKAEVEGNQTDVTIIFTNSNHSSPLDLESVILHPCVHTTSSCASSPEGALLPRKWRFTPPSYRFTLCYYTVSSRQDLPIYGIYKMRGDTVIDFILQLKLNDKVKNNFECCDVLIPFAQRGTISQIECKPSFGSVQLIDGRRCISWTIGQKFPTKNLEVTLTAKVFFQDGTSSPTTSHDGFKGKNAYCEIIFKQTNFTLSGFCVDPKTVTISPSCKVKVQTEQTLQTFDYKIWNSCGEPPYLLLSPPVDKHRK